MTTQQQRKHITDRELFLMAQAMDAAKYYDDVDQWLDEVISDGGHIVEQHLSHDAERLHGKAAQAQQGEASGVWQFYQNGEWRVGMNCNNHRENTEGAGFPTRDLYTHPQPAQQVSEGYKLVPLAPTPEQFEAGETAFENGYVDDMYRAMVRAATTQEPNQ